MNQADYVSLGLAFLEGLGLVFSPCILPILPIVLAASLEGGRARPLGIIAGFIGAFTAFALLSRQLLSWLEVDTGIVRNVALGFLALFGLVMLSRSLSDALLAKTQGLANLGQNLSTRWERRQGFFSGMGIGALIGLIWTPCAGPILAAAVVQIIQARSQSAAALTVAMFALGAGLPMLALALTGRKIMQRLTFFKTHSQAVRRALGVIILAAAALIYSGADVALLAGSGGGGTEAAAAKVADSNVLRDPLAAPYDAPEIVDGGDWINSAPLKLAALRGKVVLVDFWTYSCINCVRTLPYLTAWDAKYRDKGLVIVGIHAPEFDFEKKLANVAQAVAKFGIRYPVVLDNQLKSWSAFNNRFWPAHYLIDRSGKVVFAHFGEGHYDVTEGNIRVLLGLKGAADTSLPVEAGMPTSDEQTQETYLGFSRASHYEGPESLASGSGAAFHFPEALPLHSWALQGAWRIGGENMTATKADDSLRLRFLAKKVFLVLGTEGGNPVRLKVLLNGQPVGAAGGADVKDGWLTVDRQRLYELIDQTQSGEGLLELQTEESGVQAYAFTFGG